MPGVTKDIKLDGSFEKIKFKILTKKINKYVTFIESNDEFESAFSIEVYSDD